jgi:Sulfotransferase domain
VSVIDRLAYGVKHILELDIVGPNLAYCPDDTFVVSYPESGNNWSRFLIANLLQSDPPLTLLDMERLIPSVNNQTRGFFKRMPRPRVIGDHGSFNPQYKNVIYIVRDPRDVVISNYSSFVLKSKRGMVDDSYPITKYVNEFVGGARPGVGSWGENVASWLATRGNSPRFLLLRYEDLVSETARELGKVASFLGMQVSADRQAEAVNRSSADNLRKLKKMHGGKWAQEKHETGEWQSILPKPAVAEIESAWGPLMAKLGYELSILQAVETGALNAAF